VTVPGLGDDVQVLKAGIMEIADVFAVNKADRDGVERTVAEIGQLLAVREMDQSTFLPPIVQTVARDGQGIGDLAAAIAGHRGHLETDGRLERRRRERLKREVHNIITDRLDRWAHAKLTEDVEARENLDDVYQRKLDPRTAAGLVLREIDIDATP
jgi:LAO/AO transport system kinase